MTQIARHPLAMDGKDPSNLRGDPIDRERYYSEEFMAQEWEQLWTKIWHIAGREQQLQEPGDYIVHNFMHESVIIARQKDGSLKGFTMPAGTGPNASCGANTVRRSIGFVRTTAGSGTRTGRCWTRVTATTIPKIRWARSA